LKRYTAEFHGLRGVVADAAAVGVSRQRGCT
jgi:hypothetical protein